MAKAGTNNNQDLAKKIEQKTTQQAVATTQVTNTIEALYEKVKPKIMQAAAKHMDPDRLLRLAVTLQSQMPDLKRCTPGSVLGCIMNSAQLGLEPLMGQCYYIPFNNTKKNCKEAQFVIGYVGLLELIYRSGQVKDVYAEVVYEKDDFEYELGLDTKLVHKPFMEGDRGIVKYFYAVAHMVNGGYAFVVMSKYEVDAHRDKFSKAAKSGPWVTDYIEMGKKTVLRKLAKYLPKSIELPREMTADESVRTVTTTGDDVEDIFMQGDIVEDANYEVANEEAGAAQE